MKKTFLLLSFSLLNLVACSSISPGSTNPAIGKAELVDRGRMKVSVVSDGKRVNYSKKLVHRILVPRKLVFRALAPWPKRLNLGFRVAEEKDWKGKFAGLRVTKREARSRFPALGLRKNDLITAVDKKHIRSIKDLAAVFEGLKNNKVTSLSINRKGDNHKYFYFPENRRRARN